jgi:hypothetical protein
MELSPSRPRARTANGAMTLVKCDQGRRFDGVPIGNDLQASIQMRQITTAPYWHLYAINSRPASLQSPLRSSLRLSGMMSVISFMLVFAILFCNLLYNHLSDYPVDLLDNHVDDCVCSPFTIFSTITLMILFPSIFMIIFTSCFAIILMITTAIAGCAVAAGTGEDSLQR